jgi:hypothetical protein
MSAAPASELVVTNWAPTQIAPIKIDWGDRPTITVAASA